MGFQAEPFNLRGINMNDFENRFRSTCIEFLKQHTDIQASKEMQTILARSELEIIPTTSYHYGNVWDQREIKIELRVPLPMINNADVLRSSIHSTFQKIYQESTSYAYGSLTIKPKIIGEEGVEYKEYNVMFDNIEQTIIQGIRDAKYIIWVAVGWFSNSNLFNELKKKKADGLDIRVLTIGNNSNRTLLDQLKNELGAIGIILPSNHIFHHKFCIIDLEYVMHGSYNWSNHANKNEETWATAIDRDLAKQFADKFMEMYRTQTVKKEDLKELDF